jgi:hypothetical protein
MGRSGEITETGKIALFFSTISPKNCVDLQCVREN